MGNTKEATVNRTADGHWRLFYEYAQDDASRVGLAIGGDVCGPWQERPTPFMPREKNWDNWHLSTGPLLVDQPDRPVMFYNGATRDARWRIGWVAFDPANGICATDAHVRVAVGLDYLGAAPMRGTRYGGGEEALDVAVRVSCPLRPSEGQSQSQS